MNQKGYYLFYVFWQVDVRQVCIRLSNLHTSTMQSKRFPGDHIAYKPIRRTIELVVCHKFGGELQKNKPSMRQTKHDLFFMVQNSLKKTKDKSKKSQ